MILAADAIVLPFRTGLHSGSLIHAVSHRRPAVTPDSPFSDSVRHEVGGEWVQTYTPPLTAEILASVEPVHGEPSLDSFSASSSGPKLMSFYRALISKRAGVATVPDLVSNTASK